MDLTFGDNLFLLLLMTTGICLVFALAGLIGEQLIPWYLERRRWRRARAATLCQMARRTR